MKHRLVIDLFKYCDLETVGFYFYLVHLLISNTSIQSLYFLTCSNCLS
nr:MAG TPA: hypothetical protein [Caudoviricetes sp.]